MNKREYKKYIKSKERGGKCKILSFPQFFKIKKFHFGKKLNKKFKVLMRTGGYFGRSLFIAPIKIDLSSSVSGGSVIRMKRYNPL